MAEDELTRRAAELAVTTPQNVSQILRQIRAEYGRPMSWRRCSAAVQKARVRPSSESAVLSPAGMADRIMRLLDRELAALESQSGKLDLDRIDKLAATLRRIEPIRPKAEGRKTASLRSLLTEGDQQGSSSGDLSEAQPTDTIEAPATLAALAFSDS